VRFDAIRWDAGGRRDESLLYEGNIMREAAALVAEEHGGRAPLVLDFLVASQRQHDHRLARQLAADASVMWGNVRQRDLAARLALESVRRAPTAAALAVLRQAYGHLHTVRVVLHHPAHVLVVMSDAAGSRLATGCANGAVCLRDGSSLRVVGTHPAPVRVAADLGDRFATASEDGTVRLWEWETGRAAGQVGVGAAIEKIEAARLGDTSLLVTSGGVPGQPGVVSVWDADTLGERWRSGMITDAVLDAERQHVVVAWGDHVALRRLDDGGLTARQPMEATVLAVAAQPSRPWVAASRFDASLHLVSFASDPPQRQPLGDHISRVGPVRISPYGRWLAAQRDDFHVALWDLTEDSRALLRSEGQLGVSLCFSDQGRYLGVASSETSAITVWRTDTSQHVCTVEQDRPALALFDDHANRVWVASDKAAASLVELPTQDSALATASPG
jgi:WD40 repeat protein